MSTRSETTPFATTRSPGRRMARRPTTNLVATARGAPSTRRATIGLAMAAVLLAGAAFAQAGRLEAGDAQLSSGEYVDAHPFDAEAGTMLEIALTSSEFDPYLIVLGPDDAVLLEVDDSSGQGLNVRESLRVEQGGRLLIAVTSAWSGETGAYELSLSPSAGPAAPAPGPAPAPGRRAGPVHTQPPAPPAAPEAAAPAAAGPLLAAAAAPVAPAPRIAAQPGFVTGTVSDARGQPIAGAGVLVRGATYEGGERVSFEAQTNADGTYAIRVPHGRYEAKAWVDVSYGGRFYSLLLYPLSGVPSAQVDSQAGGSLDFQWRVAGLRGGAVPPGHGPDDFYGASVDLSYCGLPAAAYCDPRYAAYDGRPIAPEGSTVRVTLVPTGPLVDGSTGAAIIREFAVQPRDDAYPYGGGIFPDYPAGGGGRTVLGADWQYHGFDLVDIPLGTYTMSVEAILPDGSRQPFRLGLSDQDVEHMAVTVAFAPWDDYHARHYSGGGLSQTTVYVRD